MPMAFFHWPFLYFLLTPLTWAGPASTDLLPPALQDVIPACAQTCLEFFVSENFPSPICGPPPNFNCLCTTDSTSNSTLGEGALACYEANCDDINESEVISVYEVCLTVSNAKPNTHGTLTATVAPAAPTDGFQSQSQASNSQASSLNSFTSSFSSASASTSAATSTKSESSSTIPSSTSFINPPVPTAPPVGGVISPTISSTSSTSPDTSSTAVSASSAPALSKPQIAGVTVAGVGAAAIAFGLLTLILCFRRRRSKTRHSGSSFGGDKIVDSERTTPDMSVIATRDFGHRYPIGPPTNPRNERSLTRTLRLETPATSTEDGWGQYQRDLNSNVTRFAPRPQVPRFPGGDHSPVTPTSSRTRNSQLLPEKPSYNLFPSPLKVVTRDSVPNLLRPGLAPTPTVPILRSPFARAAPQHPSSLDTSQAHLQGRSDADNPEDPFTAITNRSTPDIYPYFEESRPRIPPRSLRRDTPRYRMPSWELPQAAGVVRKPLPEIPTPHTQGNVPYNASKGPQHTASVEGAYRQKSNRKKDNGPRPLTHLTDASETSFEDDDEVESRDLRSALSPVKEIRSPPRSSPGGRISYPAIPVSASESPTRKPNPQRLPHPVRSDSLLTHRLGQDRAKEITNRLQEPSYQPKRESFRNTTKYKNLVNPGPEPVELEGSPTSVINIVKLPPIAPSPTPWRR